MNTLSKELIEFLNKSHSEFNAISNIKNILINEGFKELKESNLWTLLRGEKYFITRNDSSIIAFTINNFMANYRFDICASHSDSPCLKIKMCDDIISNGYHKLAVENYGGLIKSTWLDKPLSVAGRVIVKNGNEFSSLIVDIDKNLLSIPNTCIHFNREINKGYEYNTQVDLMPIIGKDYETKNSIKALISKEYGISEENIFSYDLYLYNRELASFGGINDEFIMSPKIDNLESAFLSLKGFLKSEQKKNISVYCVFNNEEIGSMSGNGADSTFLSDVLQRINFSLGRNIEEYQCAIAKSVLLSIDNAHGVHPNHPELSDPNNLVELNKGVVVKLNSNMAYTTDAFSLSLVKELCNRNNISYQLFYNRSDIRGGGTLGAISLSHVSLTSIDIGLAQLAMHSNYELAGSNDCESMFALVENFYTNDFSIEESKIKFLN